MPILTELPGNIQPLPLFQMHGNSIFILPLLWTQMIALILSAATIGMVFFTISNIIFLMEAHGRIKPF